MIKLKTFASVSGLFFCVTFFQCAHGRATEYDIWWCGGLFMFCWGWELKQSAFVCLVNIKKNPIHVCLCLPISATPSERQNYFPTKYFMVIFEIVENCLCFPPSIQPISSCVPVEPVTLGPAFTITAAWHKVAMKTHCFTGTCFSQLLTKPGIFLETLFLSRGFGFTAEGTSVNFISC